MGLLEDCVGFATLPQVRVIFESASDLLLNIVT